MVHESLVACLLMMQLLPLFPTVVGTKYPAIFVFGDSIVDAGNNNQIPTLIKSNFEPYGQDFEGGKPTGRWCNGRLFTDFISEALGMKPSIPAYLDPEFGIEDFTTGVSFASGGSGYDNFTSEITCGIPLWKELEYFKEYKKKLTSFLGKDKATETLHKALYIVTTGTNDFLSNYFLLPARSLQFTIDEYEAFLLGITKNFVTELYRLGARKISVAGVPAFGCLPISRTSNVLFGRVCRADYNDVARGFNEKLQFLVVNLSEELEGIKLVYSDLFHIFLQIIQNPDLYGFENVSEGCCGTGTFEFSFMCYIAKSLSCTVVSKYAFWDAYHPTEKAYGILADYLVKTSLSELI